MYQLSQYILHRFIRHYSCPPLVQLSKPPPAIFSITIRVTMEDFNPSTNGRLFTALDACVRSDCPVLPSLELKLQALTDRHKEKNNEEKDYRSILVKASPHHDKQNAVVELLENIETFPDTVPPPHILDAICRHSESQVKTLYSCGMKGCSRREPDTRQHLREHLLSGAHFDWKLFACGQWCVTGWKDS